MKPLFKILLFVLSSTLFTAYAHADIGISIAKNRVGFYHGSPAKWHGHKVFARSVSIQRHRHALKIKSAHFSAARQHKHTCRTPKKSTFRVIRHKP